MIDDSADKKTLRNTEGTYHFLAPECTTGEEYDPYKVDIWALGVTMFTLIFGTLPFGTKAASLTDVMDSIREDPLVIDTEAISGECEHVLRALMTKDASERITLEQLKRLAWFQLGSKASAVSERVESKLVEVTREEIEAAFTPVNNFILMVRIKMKMAGRLARARNSIDLAKFQAAASHVDGHGDSFRAFVQSALDPLTTIVDASPEDERSVATCTTSANHSPSPSSIPRKSPSSMLSRRSPSRTDATMPTACDCDGVCLTASGEMGPAKEAPSRKSSTRVSRRNSSRANELDAEDPSPKDEASLGCLMKSRSESEMDVAAVVASDCVEGATHRPRVSPSRETNVHLTVDTKLPKLELTSASPTGSPVSTRIQRQSTPRFPRENAAQGGDEFEEELQISRKSPTDWSMKLHQGIVHPAPDESFGSGLSIAASHKNVSPSKRKTQDEARIAISNIVHHSRTDTTSSSTSPVKEPSVMLQRRKSSNPYSVVLAGDAAHGPTTSRGDRSADALPRLRRSPSTNGGEPHRAPAHATNVPDQSVAFMASSNAAHVRGRDSEHRESLSHSASLYTAQGAESTGQPHENHDGDGRTEHGSGSTNQSSRTRKFRDSTVDICLPTQNNSGVDFADHPMRHVRKHPGVDTADANIDRQSLTKTTAEKTPPKGFGLFRKTSSNNVVPLELTPGNGIGAESDFADIPSPTKQGRLPRGDDEAIPVPISPRLHSPTKAKVMDATSSSPSGGSQDPETGTLSSSKAFSPRKSVLQSHESIRLLVLRRSESVKALLTGKKANGLEGTDNSLQRYPALAAVSTKGRTTASSTTSPKKKRYGPIKSAACLVQ
jgi:hypothetical protein